MSSMQTVAGKLVRGKVIRGTLLDSCGNPQITNSVYVTEGFITVSSTKNMDTGDEIKVRQANGIIGTYEPGKATVLDFTIDVNLVGIDPGFIAMCTGDAAILDSTGRIVGFEEAALQQLTQNIALEVWTDTSASLCAGGTNKLAGYMAYPLIGQNYVTVDNITDKECTATIHGMSYANPQWGRGPYGSGVVSTRTVNDAVTTGTATSPVVTSATAAFVSGDVGQLITCVKFPAGTYIVSVQSGTSATMSNNALTAGTALAFTIGVNDGSSISGPVAVSTPSPIIPGRLLAAIGANAHRHFELTPIAPPAGFTTPGPISMTLPNPY